MELPAEVTEQLSSFQTTLEALEDYLNPFLDITPKELDAQMPPLERARSHLALAQATCLLLQMHLKLHGQRPEDHPVAREMERLVKYDKKVRKALAAEELASTRPTVTLDVAAANRFIDHAISDLSQEQRHQLKQASAAAKERAGQRAPAAQQQAKRQRAEPAHVEEEAAALLEAALADAGDGGAHVTAEHQRARQPAADGAPGKAKKRKGSHMGAAEEAPPPLQQQPAAAAGNQGAPDATELAAAQPPKKKKKKSVQRGMVVGAAGAELPDEHPVSVLPAQLPIKEKKGFDGVAGRQAPAVSGISSNDAEGQEAGARGTPAAARKHKDGMHQLGAPSNGVVPGSSKRMSAGGQHVQSAKKKKKAKSVKDV